MTDSRFIDPYKVLVFTHDGKLARYPAVTRSYQEARASTAFHQREHRDGSWRILNAKGITVESWRPIHPHLDDLLDALEHLHDGHGLDLTHDDMSLYTARYRHELVTEEDATWPPTT